MMRSLYSGVSGLKTHQIKMDVIGNNIANVNTVAFKSSSTTFSEVLYQTTKSASGANALTGTGGTNAKQIGLGVTTGATTVNITTAGATQTTGNPFDLKITGNSFFVVSNGSENFFTRDGSFYVDGAGNLCMSSTGYNIMGWQVDANGNIVQDTVSPLRILAVENLTSAPEATTQASISGIIDKNSTQISSAAGLVRSLTFYDQLGYSYTAKFSIKETATEGEYAVALTDVLDGSGTSLATKYGASLDSIVDFGTNRTTVTTETRTTGSLAAGYTYDGTNFLDSASNIVTAREAYGIPADTANVQYVVTDNGDGTIDLQTTTTTKDYLIKFDTSTGKFVSINGANAVTLDFNGTYGNFLDINMNFTGTSMVDNNGSSTLVMETGDQDGLGAGKKLGTMTGVSIQNNGCIYGTYDNGNTKLLGQIAVASFANPSGLSKEGENLYAATLNSGEFDGIGQDITADGGSMSSGVLEMSNVDLSAEFTEMITTQRGFQANSRIITTSDSMLEELINLKR